MEISPQVKPLHLVAAVVLLLYAFMLFESHHFQLFFFIAGFTALLISLSRRKFLSQPFTDALALWFEAVAMAFAAFRIFSSGKVVLPWLFLGLAIFYIYQGFRRSGLK